MARKFSRCLRGGCILAAMKFGAETLRRSRLLGWALVIGACGGDAESKGRGGLPDEGGGAGGASSVVSVGMSRGTSTSAACPALLPRTGRVEPNSERPDLPVFCEQDTDCTSRPLGFCTTDNVGTYCDYACTIDADCGGGQRCSCGLEFGRCVETGCRTDNGCGPSSLGSEYRVDCTTSGFACTTLSDTCEDDSDCNGFDRCTLEIVNPLSDPPTPGPVRRCLDLGCSDD